MLLFVNLASLDVNIQTFYVIMNITFICILVHNIDILWHNPV